MQSRLAVVLGLALVAGAPAAHATAFFTGLGFLPGATSSSAAAVSADGSTVVGGSGPDGYRWTAQEGMISIVGPPGPHSIGVSGVSGDGSVVVGNLTPPGVFWEATPYRWTAGDGIVPLGFTGRANAISADGNVVVGRLPRDDEHDGFEAFRWTQEDGPVRLGFCCGVFFSNANDVSEDGSLVLGRRDLEQDEEFAILWLPPFGYDRGRSGPYDVLDLPGGGTRSQPGRLSPNGRFATGVGSNEEACPECLNEAFLWEAGVGYVGMGFLASPGAVSDTGVVLVENDLWDEVHGRRPLLQVLTEHGLDLTGWTITRASDISSDGLTLVGTGTNPDGATEAWIAFVPEPGEVGLLAIGLAGLVARDRRQGRKVVASWRSSQ